MPFISPFLTLLCETLGKYTLCPLSQGFLFFESRSYMPIKKNLDILLCGIVKMWPVNIMVNFNCNP